MSPEWPSASAVSVSCGIDRVAVGAIDIDLLHHRKRDAVRHRAEGLDLLGRAGLLTAELVARESNHGETTIGVLLLQRFEPGVLRREPALRGDVDGKNRLAVECGRATTRRRGGCGLAL